MLCVILRKRGLSLLLQFHFQSHLVKSLGKSSAVGGIIIVFNEIQRMYLYLTSGVHWSQVNDSVITSVIVSVVIKYHIRFSAADR